MTVDNSTTRVVIVDDNIVVRMGLRGLLESTDQTVVVGEAGNGRAALCVVRDLRPDVVLLDLRMPLCDGLAVITDLVNLTRVIVLSQSTSDDDVWMALRQGASGFLIHGSFTAEELIRAIRDQNETGRHLSPQAAATIIRSTLHPTKSSEPGKTRHNDAELSRWAREILSRREQEIMEHISRGLSNAEIARTLFLTEKTVKNHTNHIYAKLRVRNRAEAIAVWLGLADREFT